MRMMDIERIATVIRCSGIATKTQREAIILRIKDWFKELNEEAHGRDRP